MWTALSGWILSRNVIIVIMYDKKHQCVCVQDTQLGPGLCDCVHGCIKRAFAWVVMTQTLVKHSCPDLLCRRSQVWWHQPESRLTKPSSAFWRAWVTGNEEAAREEEERGEGPPSPALVLLFLPHFSLFTSQECKSLKPPDLRKGNQWRWCRDLKADPPCVSHRQWPHLPAPLSPPFLSLSVSVWRSPGSSLYSDRCIWAFSVCFCCVLKGWGAKLCFTWSLNPSQIKPCVRGPFITIVCSPKATQWVTGTKAVHWAGLRWLSGCRQPSVPPHFQYWPSCLV